MSVGHRFMCGVFQSDLGASQGFATSRIQNHTADLSSDPGLSGRHTEKEYQTQQSGETESHGGIIAQIDWVTHQRLRVLLHYLRNGEACSRSDFGRKSGGIINHLPDLIWVVRVRSFILDISLNFPIALESIPTVSCREGAKSLRLFVTQPARN